MEIMQNILDELSKRNIEWSPKKKNKNKNKI